MIDCFEFISAMKKMDIRFVTGVPDSLLKELCGAFLTCLKSEEHVIASNEGSAIGLSIGHYLATSRPALIYLQNSGLGNTINPITSLADPMVYSIPMLLLIGWRGEILDDQSQMSDEPQHQKQGQITLDQLNTIGVPYFVIDKETSMIHKVLEQATEATISRGGPVAIVVRKNTFVKFQNPTQQVASFELTREDAIRTILSLISDDMCIVSTTGMASRELFEIRKELNAGHHRDFLTVGGMGHCSQIAAGIAIAQPRRKVICFDGDGSILMHAGSLAISADRENLIHIVLNNGAHDSVGGQPTKGQYLRFDRIAFAMGYQNVDFALSKSELCEKFVKLSKMSGSVFFEVRCKNGARDNLGRPDKSPIHNKLEFMNFLNNANV